MNCAGRKVKEEGRRMLQLVNLTQQVTRIICDPGTTPLRVGTTKGGSARAGEREALGAEAGAVRDHRYHLHHGWEACWVPVITGRVRTHST